jgi:hypothetical protein
MSASQLPFQFEDAYRSADLAVYGGVCFSTPRPGFTGVCTPRPATIVTLARQTRVTPVLEPAPTHQRDQVATTAMRARQTRVTL